MKKQTIVDESEQKVVAVEQQLVNFNGAEIMAVKANDEKVYVGVKWVCQGIGLSDDQMKNERKKIQSDLVFRSGWVKLRLPTNGGMQEVICIELQYIPLWLAKISISPNMKLNQPQVTGNLVMYQQRITNALAEAFNFQKESSEMMQESLKKFLV
ncbi:phage antirepressor N-terminal domain-containing protein [Bacillus cereus]|uniref:Antirepressor protein ant N-terminal domain-containing protein n=1 Tax=Bacillus cereus VD184 TaxID=1053242 RepID=A0A9W5RBD8_BACCE|nr:phage antirepressor N-terminal domain-containing protein [Bacillus cereus]EOQ18623.1 hypothetical protein IKC_05124 [Bacillus cereus VD184]